MSTTLAQGLRDLLALTAGGMPDARQLEQDLRRQGAREVLEPREHVVLSRPEPTKLALDGPGITMVWLARSETWAGCTATVFASGTLAEVEQVVGPLQPVDGQDGRDRAIGVWTSGHPVQVEVHHRAGRVGIIVLGFDRVQGRFVAVTPSPERIRLADEIEFLLELAEHPPVTARAVAAKLAARAGVVTARGADQPIPWWAELSGTGDRFAELAGSTVCGVRFNDDFRGWGCDVDLYVAYGSLDEVERIAGELERRPHGFFAFHRRTTSTGVVVRGGIEVTVFVEHVGEAVALVRLHFPASGRAMFGSRKPVVAPPRIAWQPSPEPVPSGRTDVAIVAVHELETGRIVRYELERSFTIGSTPGCDIEIPWNNPSMPEQVIYLRIAIVQDRLWVTEDRFGFELDGHRLDLAFPHLRVGSWLTLSRHFEFVIEQVPAHAR